MGGTHANVLQHLEDEFEKAANGAQKSTAADSQAKAGDGDDSEDVWKQYQRMIDASQRHSIGLKKLMGFKPIEGLPLDVTHLGVLYVLDNGKNGRFSLTDLKSFALWCAQNIPGHLSEDAFQAEVQAKTTILLWKDCRMQGSGAADYVVEWIIDVLRSSELGCSEKSRRKSSINRRDSRGSASPVHGGDDCDTEDTMSTRSEASARDEVPGQPEAKDERVTRGQMEILHQLLAVSECYGLDFQSFANLFFMAGLSEVDMASVQPSDQTAFASLNLSRGVSVQLLTPFLKQFMASYFSLLSNLGLEPLLSKEK
eukprot:gene6082-9343_t